MKNLHIALLLGSALIFSSCLNSETPDYYNFVDGRVLANGEPVSNADIHIRNHFNPGGFKVNEDNTFDIEFSVALETYFVGNLYRYRADTAFATFLSDTLEQGDHRITIPDSLLSNGIYSYSMQNERGQGFSNLIVINKPDSALPGLTPFTKTNAEGEFVLNSFNLAFGHEFSSQEKGNFEITDSLQIIITRGDSIFAKERVKVEPNTENYFEISRN